MLGLELDGSYLPLRFGPDMPDLPGGAAFLHRRQDPAGRVLGPLGVDQPPGDWLGVQCGVHHMLYGLRAAENLACLAQPGLPLFGEGAGFVFGVAGFQGGLLGQLQRLDRGGRSAVDTLEVGGEFAAPDLNGGSAGRPAGIQSGVDADDFSDRPQPCVGVGPFGEPDPRLARRWFSNAVL